MNKIINSEAISKNAGKEPDNLILIDKPEDWTSFDVVKKIKNIGKFKKVGHGGTLDPFATGLLILGTGKITKNLSLYSNADKVYDCVIEFGKETDTYDKTGKFAEDQYSDEFDFELIKKTVKSFLGISMQMPPMFSAKKVKGKKLYELARKGQEIERQPHLINIKDLTVHSWDAPFLEITVLCSKGTYIRTLAHDIGVKTNYGAYLKSLRRTEINGFSVEQALSIAQFESYWKN